MEPANCIARHFDNHPKVAIFLEFGDAKKPSTDWTIRELILGDSHLGPHFDAFFVKHVL